MKDDKCHCIVCDRPFDYMDEWSPMLRDDIWNEVIRFYCLEDVEKSNAELFDYYYDLYNKYYGTKLGDECFDKAGDYQTFICYPCMERALGRELTVDDLNGADVPINRRFVQNVLKWRK